MAISMGTVHMGKSRPRNNQSGCSDFPEDKQYKQETPRKITKLKSKLLPILGLLNQVLNQQESCFAGRAQIFNSPSPQLTEDKRTDIFRNFNRNRDNFFQHIL